MRRRPSAVVLLALGITACIDPLLGPEPDPADPVHNFDVLWREFDRYYSFFQIKGVDWDALRAEYRPRVRPDASNQELFTVMTAMLDELEDGHVNLFADVGTYAYTGWYADRPVSFYPYWVSDHFPDSPVSLAGGKLQYATTWDGLGYIRIRTFDRGLAAELDHAMAALGSPAGLIVDVRHNGGGSDTEAREMAGRLVDARRLYRTVRVRNGPDHDDFTDPIPFYVEPRGPAQYSGPIVILTNRRTFSAAESFVLAVRTRNDSTLVVGDTTGGGSGYPMRRELPNGWSYRISRWISYDADGNTFEGVGLAPDGVITFDASTGSDLILRRAESILSQWLRAGATSSLAPARTPGPS